MKKSLPGILLRSKKVYYAPISTLGVSDCAEADSLIKNRIAPATITMNCFFIFLP